MADINFQCPECKRHLSVDDAGAGQQVQCPTCARSITVPEVARIPFGNPAGFYILQSGDTKGPYTIGQLRSLWNAGSITGETQFCQEGFSEWLPLARIISDLEPSPPLPQPSHSTHRLPSSQLLSRFKITKTRKIIIGVAAVWICIVIVCAITDPIPSQNGKLPRSPIRLSFRDSLLDSGAKVLQVQNTGEKGVECSLVYQGKKYRFFVKPYEMQEIGQMEIGTSFKSGDTFKVDAEGYMDTAELPVP